MAAAPRDADEHVPASPKRAGTRIAVALLGFGAVVALVALQGTDDVLAALEAAGPKLLIVGPLFLPGLGLMALEWACCFPPGTAPGARTLLGGAAIMFGVNWLLPVARIGGDVARIRILIAAGRLAAPATASVVVDKTVQIAGQALFTLVGLALFVSRTTDARVIWSALIVTLGLCATAALLVRVQRRGLFAFLHRLAGRLLPAERHALLEGGARAFDDAIAAVWRHRGRLVLGLGAHLGFRAVQSIETWFLLDCFGFEASWVDVIVLESLSQAVRAAAFLVPGALGVQEGAFLALGATFGLPGDLALSTSLGKRLRELLIGLPGLLAWWIRESQLALSGARSDSAAGESE